VEQLRPQLKIYLQLNNLLQEGQWLRASPRVLSMWLQTAKVIANNSKCAGLGQKIGFIGPNSFSLPWLVKGATQLCTSRKKCNKLDLTAAQYFWLVDHNDWSRWFAISSSHVCTDLVTVLLVGLPNKKAKLRHLILLSRVTVTYRWRCSKVVGWYALFGGHG
jgi:hypothetical protein